MVQLFSLCLAFAAGAMLTWAISRMRRFPVIDDDVFRLVAKCASDGLVLQEKDSKIIWVNPAYCRIIGYEAEDLIGRYPLEFVLPPEECLSPEEARAFRFDPGDERFTALTRVRNMRGDGTIFMHEFSHAVIPTRKGDLYLVSSRDVSVAEEREKALIAAHERIEQKAATDALTGLANRLEMHRVLKELLASPDPFAVLQVDLNDFKDINDTLGHNAGDALLCHFAQILIANADPTWINARTGGDEFVILAPNLTTLDEALASAANIVKASKAPLNWKSGTIVAQPSVGVAVRTDAIVSADELLNAADVALYSAKGHSAPFIAGYDADLHEAYMREQQLQKDVSRAFETGEIIFHFQPIVDIQTRRVVKFEVLARWLHPENGLVPPGVFMTPVKHLGLMQRLDGMVIETACETLRALTEAGFEKTGLSINISEDGLFGEVPAHMIWQADAGQLDASRISVEVLETTAISLAEDDAAITTLDALGKAGFRIFLDDFGMGYAGLSHLAGLDVDGIKIDRGLISMIDSNDTSHSVVAALINLCNELTLEVIAEGTETDTQIDLLNAIGPAYFQGYALAKPMPLDEAIAWAHAFEAPATEKTG